MVFFVFRKSGHLPIQLRGAGINMVVHNIERHIQTDSTDWKFEVFVPLIIVFILMAGGIFLHLETGKSEHPKKGIVAFETYARYSKELESISEKYSEKLKAE